MNPISLSEAQALLARYVDAKDNNRPALIHEAFTPNATLTFSIDTDTISFPAKTEGAAAIAATLVTDFAKTFDRCRTYYVGDLSLAAEGATLTVPWLVLMRETAAHTLRVGRGIYRWGFAWQQDGTYRIGSLHIHIARMDVMPDAGAAMLAALQAALPYPWLPSQTLQASAAAQASADARLAFLKEFV
ncbi:nuclear transport factor 2 family protein [Cupriavidus sp. NPDC089707]|uniref:nuclear transport factor 2 family protein n=1 Tax=Cupriavidus sp. NPDC089707 TaxID=3363963 RepID=UPI00380577DF